MQHTLEYMQVVPLEEEESQNIDGGLWWQAIRYALFATAAAEQLWAGMKEGWKDADEDVKEQFN